jgi:sigma-E factor negative regulatory protein RseC
MSDRNTIDHIGFIAKVENEFATVKIITQSACAACHAKGACNSADQEEKVMTISTRGMQFNSGEKVKVIIARQTGLKAVAFGYVYPFLLIMTVLITLTAFGISELQAGLWALISILPYYFSVYLLRDRINNTFTFKLEKSFKDL